MKCKGRFYLPNFSKIDATIWAMAGVPTAMLDGVAERFRLLSDPTRLRLLNELDHSRHAWSRRLAGESAPDDGRPARLAQSL